MTTEGSTSQPIAFEVLERVVLPLFASERDGTWHAIGTAFVVFAPQPNTALVVTAAHNIQYIQRLDRRGTLHHPTTLPEFLPPPPPHSAFDGTKVYLLMRVGEEACFAGLVRTWLRNDLDVALALFQFDDGAAGAFTYSLALDTSPVEAGATVMAVGYPTLLAQSSVDYEANTSITRIETRIRTWIGKVAENVRSESGIHKWPGCLVDFPIDSGMSGGPLIDLDGDMPVARGMLGGDLSDSPDDGRKGSGVRAFASAIWPALLMPVRLQVVSSSQPAKVAYAAKALDLVRQGFINDRGQAHMHVRSTTFDHRVTYWWDDAALDEGL